MTSGPREESDFEGVIRVLCAVSENGETTTHFVTFLVPETKDTQESVQWVTEARRTTNGPFMKFLTTLYSYKRMFHGRCVIHELCTCHRQYGTRTTRD